MSAKTIAKDKLLKYLSNTDNDFLTCEEYSTNVLGYKTGQAIHKLFSGSEIDEIEKEALLIRRARYAKASSKVDRALISEAKSGDPAAMKLYYQRMEGWSEKIQTENQTAITVNIVDYAEKR